MYTQQHRRGCCDVTLDEGYMLQTVVDLAERYQAEVAVLGREIHFHATLHE